MFQLVKKLKVAGLLHVIELFSAYLQTPPHPYLIINLSGVTKCQMISQSRSVMPWTLNWKLT